MSSLAATLHVAGCVAPRIQSAVRPRIGEVICLRGLLDVFSLGLDDLTHRLRAAGVNAICTSGPVWSELGMNIQQANLDGKLQHPLIIVGHSHGADNGVRLAKELSRWNVDVDLLILLDATTPPSIPGNVIRCLHLYQPTIFGDVAPFIFAGNPVQLAKGNTRTQLANLQVSRELFGENAAHINHFNIDEAPPVHDLIVKEVLRLCPRRQDVQRAAVVQQ